MPLVTMFLALIVAGILAFLTHRKVKAFPGQLRRMEPACAEFQEILDAEEYFNRRKLELWLKAYSDLSSVAGVAGVPWFVGKELRSWARTFRRFLNGHEDFVRKHNREYVKKELERNQRLFDTLEKYPLNDRQREAIVHDEDHNLVIAGPGTGKTSSIVGKAVYLVQSRHIPPNRILVLAYARKAKEEMVARLNDKLGEDGVGLEVRTFHSFGRKIIGAVEEAMPDLAFEKSGELSTFLSARFKEFLRDPKLARDLIRYLAYCPKPYRDPQSFSDFADFQKYHPPEHLRTVNGESVRSLEEREIADFLYLNGVEYEYEAAYEHSTADAEHAQYKPDFHLPEYGVYIEHFGIGREGNVPKWFQGKVGKSASKVYDESMQWKRELHRDKKTVLVETFSYERKEGTLLEGLRKKLGELNVSFKPRNQQEILTRMEEAQPEAVPELIRLVGTFLALYRANGFDEASLWERARQSEDPLRSKAFIKIFLPFVTEYEEELSSSGRIDYSDMVVTATRYIREGRFKSPYSYILIDEFQDISQGRYNLIRALLEQSPEQRLFCVGDDWQSVYRFAGSDINIILDFEKSFGFTKTTILDTAYRFYDRIAEVTGAFVQKNPRQLRKELQTMESKPDEPLAVHVVDDDERHRLAELLRTVDSEAAAKNENCSVYIIGRYNLNRPENLTELRRNCPNLTIEFHTAHGSKGLEADYVVVVRAIAGKYGFPSEIDDDPLLQLVLPELENFEHAEERRLFYVAMTRARRKIHILTQRRNMSSFVEEIGEGAVDRIMIICPACEHGSLELVDHSNGPFWGCRNYPHCKYTMAVRDVEARGTLTWDGKVARGKLCPGCERAYLIRRDGRYGSFWGCGSYRRDDPGSCQHTETGTGP
jgi:DNA helicase-4